MRTLGALFGSALLIATGTVAVEARPARPTEEPTCAIADDCTLREAAAAAGIEFGLLPDLNDPAQSALHLANANSITNHGFSWNVIEPSPGVWNFGPADATHAFATEHDLVETGLHFAWGQDALDDLPDWVESITDPDELRAALHNRAEVIFDRYPDLDRIDVINEPFELLGGELYQNHFYDVLGPDYIAELFDIVAAHATDTTELIVNENLVEYFPAKAEALVSLTQDLTSRGKRIDAVGLQSHLFLGEPDWDLYRQVMEQVAAMDLTVLITELDAPTEPTDDDREQLQVDRYRRAVETCLAVSACTSITVWGISDSDSWVNWFLGPGRDPLLWDGDLERKAAWFAVRDALLAGRPTQVPAPPSSTTPPPTTATTTVAPSPRSPGATPVPGQAAYTG